MSPAFLIRVGAAMGSSGSGEEEEAKENIYEEIRDSKEEGYPADSRFDPTDF